MVSPAITFDERGPERDDNVRLLGILRSVRMIPQSVPETRPLRIGACPRILVSDVGCVPNIKLHVCRSSWVGRAGWLSWLLVELVVGAGWSLVQVRRQKKDHQACADHSSHNLFDLANFPTLVSMIPLPQAQLSTESDHAFPGRIHHDSNQLESEVKNNVAIRS